MNQPIRIKPGNGHFKARAPFRQCLCRVCRAKRGAIRESAKKYVYGTAQVAEENLDRILSAFELDKGPNKT